MLQLSDLSGTVELIAQRTLQPRDAAVMFALMSHTSTHSGKISVTSAGLAQDLQMQEADIRASLSRLKRQHLLRLISNRATGERYYRLNPWLVRSSAKGGLFGLACKEFQEA